MSLLRSLFAEYKDIASTKLNNEQLLELRTKLKQVQTPEVSSAEDGRVFLELVRKFRQAVAANAQLQGDNYPEFLRSILSVGEDGVYSNNMRFIYELIQNVDDCDYENLDNCRLDMHFDWDNGKIVLTYNEKGFSPLNVFAITGIAEAAKNISDGKIEIGEKGIGFKSVFGVANKVLIQSGWFSFELEKTDFTIPVIRYADDSYIPGTVMTLYVGNAAKEIYRELRDRFCKKDALLNSNLLLFLNKLTYLHIYYDSVRSMEFRVSKKPEIAQNGIIKDENIELSVKLSDGSLGDGKGVKLNQALTERIVCTRYAYQVTYSQKACKSRYGANTKVGSNGGKTMLLQVVLPNPEYVSTIQRGTLYSFLPTSMKLSVPIACHVPYKLNASREYVDPQNENIWFQESNQYFSELLDHALVDWCKTSGTNIVYYLPSMTESLFSENNGKEDCLRKRDFLKGSHFLKFPLFKTSSGEYKDCESVFSFDPIDGITEPERVSHLLGSSGDLFISPAPFSMSKFGIRIERNVNAKLFRRALLNEEVTEDALNYLEEASYEYSEKALSEQQSIALTTKQISIINRHDSLWAIFRTYCCNAVKKKMRPHISASDGKPTLLSDALFDGFDISETSRQVEDYVGFTGGKCFLLDISEGLFLPTYDAIALSANNPVSAFANFCYEIDQKDTFSIRIKLREVSARLNLLVDDDTVPAPEFLKELKNNRLIVKESLREDGYRNYINLILKSGTDSSRFIQELLQNADDCSYAEGTTPTFSLKQNGSSIITRYNETGFTRENIRSITAIGESTKNKLLTGDFQSIGEKGVGFKTIFAVASEVRISSGDYSFSLTDKEPTIPKLRNSNGRVAGTQMEVILKDRKSFPIYNEKSILELCLCLRKLKKIDIGSHSVTIEDRDGKRTITIDNRKHVFRVFVRDFYVSDATAIAERESSTRHISPKQKIVCYVPEKKELDEYPLYVGLPTKHKVKIPIVIDAPFELTTSREEIEIDCKSWNNIVREEVYNALFDIIEVLKEDERAAVLRFSRFLPRMQGNIRVYVNDVSDCPYINQYPFLDEIKKKKLIPTFDKKVFVTAAEKRAYKFPSFVSILTDSIRNDEYKGVVLAEVIDSTTDSKTVTKEIKDRIETALNAMGCCDAPFSHVFPVIEQYSNEFIHDDEFRQILYEYLQNYPQEYTESIQSLDIIPVYSTNGGTEYICWVEDGIFVKSNTFVSPKSYYVLNEKVLSKAMCEKMLGVNINEMNAEWERNRYNDTLRTMLRGSNLEEIYYHLLSEFKKGALQKNGSEEMLVSNREVIPLKNALGKIVDTNLFICDQPEKYPIELLQCIIVDKECRDFAVFLRCSDLRNVHYEDMDYFEELTVDDAEAIHYGDLLNSDEILCGYYTDNLLSDETLIECGLEYIAAIKRPIEPDMHYAFPDVPVNGRSNLIEHVKKLWNSRVEIVSVKEQRTVQKGLNSSGKYFSLDSADVRKKTLDIYTPIGEHGICFCQMCHSVKMYTYMEVNNIEALPKYHFAETRVALCLECSKLFEALRRDKDTNAKFLASLRNTEVSNLGQVDIPIGNSNSITFTGKHLAEIQEILKKVPKE